MQKYKNDFLTIVENQAIKSDCADITFFNQGTNIVVLNSAVRIPAGGSISLRANANELDTTIYNIFFTGVGISNLTVIRKIYI